MRPTAEQKAEAIQMLNRHDTYEVEVMEAIKYNQENALLQEAAAEQADPPESRTITRALQKLVKQMYKDDNLEDLADVPAYLRPNEMTV